MDLGFYVHQSCSNHSLPMRNTGAVDKMSSAKKQGEEEPIKWFVYCGVNPDALEENDFLICH